MSDEEIDEDPEDDELLESELVRLKACNASE